MPVVFQSGIPVLFIVSFDKKHKMQGMREVRSNLPDWGDLDE